MAEQEAEAAREAAEIGGDGGDEYGVDESERALAEAGQGESEGFELAEQELVENASHDLGLEPGPDSHGRTGGGVGPDGASPTARPTTRRHEDL